MTNSHDTPDALITAVRSMVQTMPAMQRKRIRAAIDLAVRAHKGHTRKHGTQYVTHPLRVTLLLANEFGVSNSVELSAALLHDVLEDAPERTSPNDIRSACGDEVLRLVQTLTSPSDTEVPDKAERSRIKAERVRLGSREAWRIKIADRIDNLRDSLLLSGELGRTFRSRYHDESAQYYRPLAEDLGDPRVLQVFLAAMRNVEERLATDSTSSMSSLQ